MAYEDLYEGMYDPIFPLRKGVEIAQCNLSTIRSWLQQRTLRMLEGDQTDEVGRRERWVSSATVLSFVLADRAVKAGVSSKHAGELSYSFVSSTAGGARSGWVGETPDPLQPFRLPGQLFTCDDALAASSVQTWAAFPAGDAPGRIVAIFPDRPFSEARPFSASYKRASPEAGLGLLLMPLDELVVATLIRCRTMQRQSPRPARESVDVKA